LDSLGTITGEPTRPCGYIRSYGSGRLVIMNAPTVLIWSIGCYALLALAIIGWAAYVAVFVHDPRQRQDAYKVLKLMLGAITGTGGLFVLLMKLRPGCSV
jgi:hypothetical protein